MPTSKSGPKAGATKRTSSRSTSTKKNTTAASATKTRTAVAAPAKTTRVTTRLSAGGMNYPAIIIAEVIGTFTLTLIALATMQQVAPLYVGLTLAVFVLTIGAVSGAHINPAVTFGLWAARKVKAASMPVYWIAQFVGAILAILALGALSGSGYPLDFGHFASIHWGVLGAEAIGAAIFLFGFTASLSNERFTPIAKAFGIGFSLTLGLVVSTTLFTTVQTAKIQTFQEEQATAASGDASVAYPAEIYIKGTTINPAIALATTEYTDSELSGMPANGSETVHSRFDLNTIIGTLVGAAIGSNLYLLVVYANRGPRV